VPTIRSRCQQLLLNPLPEAGVKEVLKTELPDLEDFKAERYAKMANGSPGLAIRLSVFDGEGLFDVAGSYMGGAPLSTKQTHDFAGALGLQQNEERYFLFLDILAAEIAAKIKALALEPKGKSRLDVWLDLWDKVDQIRLEGEGINLGRKQMLIVLLSDLAAAGRAETKAA